MLKEYFVLIKLKLYLVTGFFFPCQFHKRYHAQFGIRHFQNKTNKKKLYLEQFTKVNTGKYNSAKPSPQKESQDETGLENPEYSTFLTEFHNALSPLKALRSPKL